MARVPAWKKKSIRAVTRSEKHERIPEFMTNVDNVIETVAMDHKALLAVNVADKTEQAKAFEALKESHAALMRDVAQMAFRGERSKRKQWAELQKEITDLLEEGRGVVEAEEGMAPEGNWEEKLDRRYQRMGSRIARLAGG